MKKIFLSILLLITFFAPIYAQDSEVEQYKGKVVLKEEVSCGDIFEDTHSCYEYEVYISKTDETVRTVQSMLEKGEPGYAVGDAVFLSSWFDGQEMEDVWTIVGYSRGTIILFLVILFIIVALFVGGKRGFGSLISLIISFLVLYSFMIPNMLRTNQVILYGYLAIILILGLTIYLSHGFSKMTTVALISTVVGVTIISIVAYVFIRVANLTGAGEEDAFFLLSQTEGTINLRNVFFMSIVIGSVGVLDDVAVGQVFSMYEVYKANPSMSSIELFKSGMNVGREHVSSMINTLFIVYAGSSLALVMLLAQREGSFANIINIDIISEEIIRTISVSLGLLLVVPLSTFIASKSLILWSDKGTKTLV